MRSVRHRLGLPDAAGGRPLPQVRPAVRLRAEARPGHDRSHASSWRSRRCRTAGASRGTTITSTTTSAGACAAAGSCTGCCAVRWSASTGRPSSSCSSAGSTRTGRSSAGSSRGCSRRPRRTPSQPASRRTASSSSSICDDDSIADVLLVNGFHAELKCPVLSYSGYPAHVYEPLIRLLRERPPATVVVIHDADWDGCRLRRCDRRRSALVRRRRAAEGGRCGAAPRRRAAFPRALPAGRPAVSTPTSSADHSRGGEVARQVPPRAGGGAAARADGRPRARASRRGRGRERRRRRPLVGAGDVWGDGDDEVG